MNTDQEFKQKKCSFESQTIKSWLLCSGLSQSCFLASIFNLVQRPRKDPLKWVYGSLNAWMGAQHSKISAAMHNFYSASSWKEERSALWWLNAQKNWVAWVSFSPGLFQLRKKRSALCTGLRLLCDRNGTIRARDPPKSFDTDACIWKQVASCLHSFFALSSNNISLTLSLWSRHCMSGRS